MDQFNENGCHLPSWNWGDEQAESWQSAKHEWTGILTYQTLKVFKKFGRLPKDKK